MNIGWFLVTVLGGGIGAALRFVADGLVMRHVSNGYPWGTSFVNLTGAFVLGILTGLADSSVLDADWMFVLGVGVLGGYTTFSTAMVDVVHLAQKRAPWRAIAHSLGMLVAAVVLAGLGILLGRAL